MKTVQLWAGMCALGLSLIACVGPAESNRSTESAPPSAGNDPEVTATPTLREQPASQPAAVPEAKATLRFRMKGVR